MLPLIPLLTACGTTISSGCPPLVTYPDAVQDKAAAELDAMPAASVLPGMMRDYRDLRAELRAGCEIPGG